MSPQSWQRGPSFPVPTRVGQDSANLFEYLGVLVAVRDAIFTQNPGAVPAGVARAALSTRSTVCYTSGMARIISQRQLRNESGEIMRGLDRGETFVVTRNGAPVGELTPLRRHRFVSADSAIAMFRGAPRVDLRRLRNDLDTVASQDLSPRA